MRSSEPRRVVTVNLRFCQRLLSSSALIKRAQNHSIIALPSGKPASIEIFQNLNGDVSADAGLIAKGFHGYRAVLTAVRHGLDDIRYLQQPPRQIKAMGTDVSEQSQLC